MYRSQFTDQDDENFGFPRRRRSRDETLPYDRLPGGRRFSGRGPSLQAAGAAGAPGRTGPAPAGGLSRSSGFEPRQRRLPMDSLPPIPRGFRPDSYHDRLRESVSPFQRTEDAGIPLPRPGRRRTNPPSPRPWERGVDFPRPHPVSRGFSPQNRQHPAMARQTSLDGQTFYPHAAGPATRLHSTTWLQNQPPGRAGVASPPQQQQRERRPLGGVVGAGAHPVYIHTERRLTGRNNGRLYPNLNFYSSRHHESHLGGEAPYTQRVLPNSGGYPVSTLYPPRERYPRMEYPDSDFGKWYCTDTRLAILVFGMVVLLGLVGVILWAVTPEDDDSTRRSVSVRTDITLNGTFVPEMGVVNSTEFLLLEAESCRDLLTIKATVACDLLSARSGSIVISSALALSTPEATHTVIARVTHAIVTLPSVANLTVIAVNVSAPTDPTIFAAVNRLARSTTEAPSAATTAAGTATRGSDAVTETTASETTAAAEETMPPETTPLETTPLETTPLETTPPESSASSEATVQTSGR